MRKLTVWCVLFVTAHTKLINLNVRFLVLITLESFPYYSRFTLHSILLHHCVGPFILLYQKVRHFSLQIRPAEPRSVKQGFNDSAAQKSRNTGLEYLLRELVIL